MKSVLISIRPKWCEKIASGQKTIEVRKSAPKEVPFKAYIYETKGETETPWVDEDGHFIYKGRGQVVGEFVCDKVIRTCGWHISDLKIYDKPKELGEFSPICSYKNDDGSCQYHKVDCLYQQRDYNTDGSVNLVTCGKSINRAPQSWQYVEEL